jgi:hypothetical protein
MIGTMNISKLSVLLPPQPPSGIDLFVGVVSLIALMTDYFLEQNSGPGVALPVAVATFVLGVLTAGPGARSSLGHSLAQWLNDIGYAGRFLVFGSGIVVILIVFSTLPIPNRVVSGLSVGILSSVVVTVSVNYLHAKTVGRSNAAYSLDEVPVFSAPGPWSLCGFVS